MSKAVKSLRFLSSIVLFIAFLCGFGYVVKNHADKNSENALYSALDVFVSFPETVFEVAESKEIRGIPPTFEAVIASDTFNYLSYDVFGLMTLFNQQTKDWNIHVWNFKTDSTLHTWNLSESNFIKTDREWANSEPRNPILLPNRHLITHNDETKNLYRLDENSNIVWKNIEKIFHHSLNLDHENNIWACTGEFKKINIPQQKEPTVLEDDFVTKINSETGEVMFTKSTVDIFLDNNLKGYVFGLANGTHDRTEPDPLHLNDIEPVLTDGAHWKQGDLLLSFRNRSSVVLYRPSTNKIIRLIQGPFMQQHDVDILNDSTISIFNNASMNIGTTAIAKWKWENLPISYETNYSSIVQYNLADSTFTVRFEDHFREHELFSMYQGFHHQLTNGTTYVEDYTDGLMLFMNDDRVVYKKQSPNRLDTLVENPHWVRIYEDIAF